MKVLVAGATGAIGKPLIKALIANGQDVYGITHSEERARMLASAGATPLSLDVFNKEAVFATMASLHPDVVIDMLTALPKTYTPESMKNAAEFNDKLRIEGGGNLHEAAEKYGVSRYIAQSTGFYYEPGLDLADETTPFALKASPGIAAGAATYALIEKRALQSKNLEGVALRFGFFYGPGTWFNPDGDIADQVHQGVFPIIGSGEGVWNFVHVEDAAKATAAAIYIHPGAYNIVNDRPAKLKSWLPAFARYVNASYPHQLSIEEGLEQFGPDVVYYATKLRGASNTKIKREFNFDPRNFEWFF